MMKRPEKLTNSLMLGLQSKGNYFVLSHVKVLKTMGATKEGFSRPTVFLHLKLRPGSIRVFMYPGRVCNLWAGTRITGTVRIHLNFELLF